MSFHDELNGGGELWWSDLPEVDDKEIVVDLGPAMEVEMYDEFLSITDSLMTVKVALTLVVAWDIAVTTCSSPSHQ